MMMKAPAPPGPFVGVVGPRAAPGVRSGSGRPSLGATLRDGRGEGPSTSRPIGNGSTWERLPPVGSKMTQPYAGKYTSTQAWAFEFGISSIPVSGLTLPGRDVALGVLRLHLDAGHRKGDAVLSQRGVDREEREHELLRK